MKAGSVPEDGPAGPHGLRLLELLGGAVHGADPSVPPLTPAAGTARRALEDVLLRALENRPCVLSFSGGRDSSALLALASDVAARHGLDPPVPVTLRFPGRPESDEDEWQELVVRNIGLDEWVRLPFNDELDYVGPYATALLRRCGPMWPANAHSHLPLAALAPGGSMITGFGGDELLLPDSFRHRLGRVATGELRPHWRDAVRLASLRGPVHVRRVLRARNSRGVPPRSWLRPVAERAVVDAELSASRRDPMRWDRLVRRTWWHSRYRTTAEATVAAVGAMHGTTVFHPFTDPGFLDAVAREGGRNGFPTRSAAMRHLFGDLLPDEVITRTSKAVLSRGFWTGHSATFAAQWDGGGADPDLIDVDVLRDLWSGTPRTDFRTASLLQTAWLAVDRARTARSDGRTVTQAVHTSTGDDVAAGTAEMPRLS